MKVINIIFFSIVCLVTFCFHNAISQDRFIKRYSSNQSFYSNIMISQSDMIYLGGSDFQNKELTILKTDLNGSVIWQKKFYRNCFAPLIRKILENGPYITVFGEAHTETLNCQNFVTIWFAMNLDTATGSIIHQYVKGDTSTYFQTVNDAIILPDKSFITIGLINYTPFDTTYGLIMKFDQNLNTVWSKKVGGYKNVEYHSIIYTDYNNIFLGGRYQPNIDFDYSSILTKIDSSGSIKWNKQFDVSNKSIEILSLEKKDSIIFAGGINTDMFTSQPSGIILKYDTAGNILLAKYISGIVSQFLIVNDTTLIIKSNGINIISDLNITNTHSIGVSNNVKDVSIDKTSLNTVYGSGAPYLDLIKFDSTFSTCLNNSPAYIEYPITSYIDTLTFLQEYSYQHDTIGVIQSSSSSSWVLNYCSSTNNTTEEFYSKKIALFPNPSNSVLYIEDLDFHNDQIYYQIINMMGQIVDGGFFRKHQTINIKKLSKGLYSLILFDKSISRLTFVKI